VASVLALRRTHQLFAGLRFDLDRMEPAARSRNRVKASWSCPVFDDT
jgi:hypothetical protein